MAVTVYAAFNRPTQSKFSGTVFDFPEFVQWFAKWTVPGVIDTPKVARIATLSLGLPLKTYTSDFILLFTETDNDSIPECDIAIPVAFLAPDPNHVPGPRSWQRARYEAYSFDAQPVP